MKKIIFTFTFIVLTLSLSKLYAQTTDKNKLEYDGVSFELTMSLKTDTKDLNLNKNLEGSLRKGGVNSRSLLVHPKSYLNDTIIGLTFYNRCFNSTELKALHFAYKESFEKHYNASFKAIEFEFFTSLDGNYYYLELENDLILVLGDVMYNAMENNYITVSYFRGISVEGLTNYLSALY